MGVLSWEMQFIIGQIWDPCLSMSWNNFEKPHFVSKKSIECNAWAGVLRHSGVLKAARFSVS